MNDNISYDLAGLSRLPHVGGMTTAAVQLSGSSRSDPLARCSLKMDPSSKGERSDSCSALAPLLFHSTSTLFVNSRCKYY